MHSLLVTAPIAFAQFLLQNLAGASFWERVKKLNRFGNLEARQFRPAVVYQLILADRFAWFKHHQGFGRLAPTIVRYRDYGALKNGGVRIDSLFNLDGGDVLAAADYDVFLAIDDQEIALFIYDRHVAGMKPAVSHHISRLLGPLPISLHYVIRADDDFTPSLPIVRQRVVGCV